LKIERKRKNDVAKELIKSLKIREIRENAEKIFQLWNPFKGKITIFFVFFRKNVCLFNACFNKPLEELFFFRSQSVNSIDHIPRP
jgi:hypothetical protein